MEGQVRLHLRPARHAHHLHAGSAHRHAGRRPANRAGAQRPGGHRQRGAGAAENGRRGADARQRLRPQQNPGRGRTGRLRHHPPVLRPDGRGRPGRAHHAQDQAGVAGSRWLGHPGNARPDRPGPPVPRTRRDQRAGQHLGRRPGLQPFQPGRPGPGGGCVGPRPHQIPQRRRRCADGIGHHARRSLAPQDQADPHAPGPGRGRQRR